MYIYYNMNPEGKTIGDCVIRAISLALGIEYYEVIEMLYRYSDNNECDMLSKDCYGGMLGDNFKIPRFTAKNATVKQVAEDFKDNILIIRVNQHLTTSIKGDIYDIWNPENEKVDCFWIVR